MDIEKIYNTRFSPAERVEKNKLWKVLCKAFFMRFIKPDATVVDIGAGYCEFINNISCQRKIAVDINPSIEQFAQTGVEIIAEPCWDLRSLADNSVDIVFMSNFLEHLLNKQQVYDTLKESRRILKPSGKLLLLQPNIRFLANNYWDFFDHHTALSDRSLREVLELLDFDITHCYPRFLPYSTKSALPQHEIFVRLYLKLPFVWPLFGRQAFIVAEKTQSS